QLLRLVGRGVRLAKLLLKRIDLGAQLLHPDERSVAALDRSEFVGRGSDFRNERCLNLVGDPLDRCSGLTQARRQGTLLGGHLVRCNAKFRSEALDLGRFRLSGLERGLGRVRISMPLMFWFSATVVARL